MQDRTIRPMSQVLNSHYGDKYSSSLCSSVLSDVIGPRNAFQNTFQRIELCERCARRGSGRPEPTDSGSPRTCHDEWNMLGGDKKSV